MHRHSRNTWYGLWQRLGRQPIYKTQGHKIIVKHNDAYYYAKLTFINDGKSFCIETICEV